MSINGNKFLMLSIRRNIFSALGIVSLLFMVYSGYIKWIPGLFMDPFIFFIILLFITVLLSGFKNIFKKDSIGIVVLLVLFFTWALISTVWGISNIYYSEKIQKSIVILVCFMSPFFVLRTKERIKEFIYTFHLLTFVTAGSILAVFIIYGDLFIIFYGEELTEQSRIPDYLALGILLASGFVISIHETGRFWLIYKTLIVIAIVLLAPRGPLLTLGLFIIVYYVGKGKLKVKWYVPIFALIVGVFTMYFSEGLTGRLLSRFSDLSDTNSSAFSSIGSRFELLNSALDYFTDSPIFGIGYGSFGVKYLGAEDRIEPHNILIEIAAETGVIGFVLFSLFILGVYYYAVRKKQPGDPIVGSLIILTLYLIVQSLSSTYLIDSKALFLWLGILVCYTSKPKNLNEIEKT